ncbi:MAG: hypothetical protein ACLTLQ_09365 [[Clostridium] scindens]
MSIEKVRAYFRQYGIEDRVREVEESSATVEAAAMALGCEAERILPRLCPFYLGDSAILVKLTAGVGRSTMEKYRAQFGCKAPDAGR